MKERLIFDATYLEPDRHRASTDEQRHKLFVDGIVRRAREWGVELRIVDPATTCLDCGKPARQLEDASTLRKIRVEPEPVALGDMLIIPEGRVDAGRALRIGGPLLDRARAQKTPLYQLHVCEVPDA